METALDVFHIHLEDTKATFASHFHPIRLSQSSSFHHHHCFLNRIALNFHRLEFLIANQHQSLLSYPHHSRLLQINHLYSVTR